jgi:hypothetical protein
MVGGDLNILYIPVNLLSVVVHASHPSYLGGGVGGSWSEASLFEVEKKQKD